MIGASFRAMGTTVQVAVAREEDVQATQRWFEYVEQRFSRFIESSELSEINRSGEPSVLVSPELAELLQLASDFRRRTGGLVDPGVGGAVCAWGYDRDFDSMRGTVPEVEAVGEPGWSITGNRLDKPPGTLLDLGGIAKGWTCDRAVEAGTALIVNAGGDVRSGSSEAEVDIVDPWGRVVGRVALGVGALATSSTMRRRWTAAGGVAHHLIDPRTLNPSGSPVVSSTVIAGTGVEAEAGAKAVLLKGVDGLAWASSQEWIRGAVIVWEDGNVYGTGRLDLEAA